jgi:hypothetical protein
VKDMVSMRGLWKSDEDGYLVRVLKGGFEEVGRYAMKCEVIKPDVPVSELRKPKTLTQIIPKTGFTFDCEGMIRGRDNGSGFPQPIKLYGNLHDYRFSYHGG